MENFSLFFKLKDVMLIEPFSVTSDVVPIFLDKPYLHKKKSWKKKNYEKIDLDKILPYFWKTVSNSFKTTLTSSHPPKIKRDL